MFTCVLALLALPLLLITEPSHADAPRVKHVIAYQSPGHFAGWPANEGFWSWGDEILVGFEVSRFKERDDTHNVDPASPKRIVFARSLDGGETWAAEEHAEIAIPAYLGNANRRRELAPGAKEPKPCPGGINFAHPDFAMKIRNQYFYVSTDRGRKWDGPFTLPDFAHPRLMTRTNYLVVDANTCRIFAETIPPGAPRDAGGERGQTFMAETTDGGRTWKQIAWLAPDPWQIAKESIAYSIMPDLVTLEDGTIVTSIRERSGAKKWTDVYASRDEGRSWDKRSRIFDGNNNPAALVKLGGERLAAVYGWRNEPFGIRAKISEDGGRTWGREVVLRDDAREWDLGYVRAMRRGDGKIVAVYYYTTKDNPEQHIAATIWEPPPAPAVSARKPVNAKEVTVFDGYKGWEHDGIIYRLACGVSIAEAGNGDLLAYWLSGADTEPSPDNCILLARSSDGGHTWSEPSVFIPAGEHAGAVSNLFATESGQLVALGAQWPSEEEYTRWNYFRMTSDDHGKTWSSPQPINLRDGRAALGRRIRLSDGRWLFPSNLFLPRAKPLHGTYEQLAKATSETEAAGLAETGAEVNNVKFSRFLHGCMSFIADDAFTTFEPGGIVNNRPLGLLEPTVIQLKDGSVVMLMRAEWGGFLWKSVSTDGGRTWSPAEQTDIPNPSSLADLMRWPDGRIFLLHNPNGGKVGGRGSRDPLAMWVSDDEMKTWSAKATLASGARCAYPHALRTRDGKLLVAYDRDRRQVRVVHVNVD